MSEYRNLRSRGGAEMWGGRITLSRCGTLVSVSIGSVRVCLLFRSNLPIPGSGHSCPRGFGSCRRRVCKAHAFRRMPAGRPQAMSRCLAGDDTHTTHVARTLAVCMIVREVDVEDWRPVECPVDHGAHDVNRAARESWSGSASGSTVRESRAAAALGGEERKRCFLSKVFVVAAERIPVRC